MKIKYCLICLIIFLLVGGCTYSNGQDLIVKGAEWSFYGDGYGASVTGMARKKDQSSLWLSTDWGEVETAFYKWNDLKPGTYKVTTYVRAQDVQKGSEGVSFWHFYDGGDGTISPFTDLHGDYEWRKVTYTIKVKKADLTVWFRLKSPGQIWVDEFYLEKVEEGDQAVSIAGPEDLIVSTPRKTLGQKNNSSRKVLFSFDRPEAGHPFSISNQVGKFAAQKFYNFSVAKMPVNNWSPYDRLEMDVYNPNENYTEFYLTLADDKTTNYWSQANHKQTLAPGWNKLNFSLTQYVGERGSHRFNRPIDLSKLKKVFIVIDPDSKSSFENETFFIDNITLSTNPMPQIPEGVWAFDFTAQKANGNNNLLRVTTQTIFNERRNFGFYNPKFWRVENSQYASELLKYSIGLTGGHFKVKLPNGKYHLSLIVDKLGYWDVPFWADRTIYANGIPIFKESRATAGDFLNDLLRFETIAPEIHDHPYDLYLSKIFSSIDKVVEVTDEMLDLEFEGDATGISLNSLLLWNKKNDLIGLAYKKELEKRNKLEFEWMSHSIQNSSTQNPLLSFALGVVEPDLYLNPVSARKIDGSILKFQGGVGERPYQLIQLSAGLSADEKISWNVDDFTNDKAEKINKNDLQISDLVFQYTSPDINHETYLLTGKYLRPMADHSLIIKKGQNRYLWLQLQINGQTPVGLFKGAVIFHRGGETIKFPVEMEVLAYELPKVDFPVGFFGLDPLPYSYYPGKGYPEMRKKYRHLALNKLGEAGFTTFTGLPDDLQELDDLLKEASAFGIKTVFSYGGQFPQSSIDLSKKPANMSDDDYYAKVASELETILAKKEWPRIVHTFSDEAGGYSDRVASDIELAKKFKQHFPFMSLGGFGSFHGADSKKLNSYFDYGLYSGVNKSDITFLGEKNQRWGLYNTSAGNLDDPRFSFGLGLYIARLNGLAQYLEWHSSAFNNYPYYDFDGRESDVVMFFPTRDGRLLPSLRFELATEGLHAYKKLKLLEEFLAVRSEKREVFQTAKKWLDNIRRENHFFSSTNFMHNKKNNFRDFEKMLDQHLKNIFTAR